MSTAGTVHARDLDAFVAECDRRGTISHPECREYVRDFTVTFDTAVDQTLDPFSDKYVAQMVTLYEELSGRKLDQESGEMTAIDVAAHAAAVNPYNSRDVRFLSKHNRAVLTAAMLANLPPHAEVLDAGCGWGLSSEAMAFSGCRVTALDINPLFVDLVTRRAERLGLPIETVRSEFDTFTTDKRFDLLFFYECLHHSVKPWETLTRLGRFVKPDGKIAFAGEPVNGIWWRNWGLRLDAESLYCVRKFGWWESGWTREFIAQCCARAGFTLRVFENIGLNCEQIGYATWAGSTAEPDLTAWRNTPHVHTNTPPAAAPVTETWREPVAALAAEIAALRAEIKVPKPPTNELAEAHAEIGRLRHAIESMRASRSWRATRPVRSLVHALRPGRA